MSAVKHAASALIGFGAGMVISGAVFAFLTVIGIVPRMAQKTRTQRHVTWYESAIVAGGLLGTVAGFFNPRIPLTGLAGAALVALLGLAVGIFYGVLAMCLAETLNVIPILTRRIRLQRGMFYFILALAAGKLLGAILYALIPGFYKPG